jgi:hypothetical protein
VQDHEAALILPVPLSLTPDPAAVQGLPLGCSSPRLIYKDLSVSSCRRELAKSLHVNTYRCKCSSPFPTQVFAMSHRQRPSSTQVFSPSSTVLRRTWVTNPSLSQIPLCHDTCGHDHKGSRDSPLVLRPSVTRQSWLSHRQPKSFKAKTRTVRRRLFGKHVTLEA